MKSYLLKLSVLTIVCIQNYNAMIIRNNALMSKMVSHFQKDNNLSINPPQETKSENVLALMQNVLCRNFPTIPCDMIVQDTTLKKLIEKSIQQIKYKKLSLEKTTPSPGYHLTLFPVLNSEDISNFLQVSDTGYYNEAREREAQNAKQKKSITAKNIWSHEKVSKKKRSKTDSQKTTVFNGRKKIRKFYPHKIKYKDKAKNVRKDFGDYSEEKLSMSVELPELSMAKRHHRLTYKVEQSDPPVWRIDYMKHGEPSLKLFPFEADNMHGKIMKTGPNVVVDENVLEQAARRDVMHPDVYIKKNYVRKNIDINSEGID